MVNPPLLFVSALFFLGASAALYTVAWLSVTTLLKFAHRLPIHSARAIVSGCLLLPPIVAGAFTAGGAFLRHHHTEGKIHHGDYCGDIARFLTVPEGRLPGIVGLAVQGAAWILLAWGGFKVLRLLHATIALESSLSSFLQPPSDKLAAALAKTRSQTDCAALPFFEADIPMAYSCLIGIQRIRCVLSKELVAASTHEELEAVVIHETNHYRSGDIWRTLLVGTLNCVFFYLRPVTLLTQLWREKTELACDAVTASATGEPLALAAAILRTQGVPIKSRPLPNATLGFAEETACSPTKRVEFLLEYARGAPPSMNSGRARAWQWASTVVLALFGILFLLAPQTLCLAHCGLEAITRVLR